MAMALNAPAFSDFDKIMSKLGPVEIRLIIWAGLLHKFPNIKKDDVGDLIEEYLEEHEVPELTDLVMTALTEASVFARKPDKGDSKVQDSESTTLTT